MTTRLLNIRMHKCLSIAHNYIDNLCNLSALFLFFLDLILTLDIGLSQTVTFCNSFFWSFPLNRLFTFLCVKGKSDSQRDREESSPDANCN